MLLARPDGGANSRLTHCSPPKAPPPPPPSPSSRINAIIWSFIGPPSAPSPPPPSALTAGVSYGIGEPSSLPIVIDMPLMPNKPAYCAKPAVPQFSTRSSANSTRPTLSAVLAGTASRAVGA